MRDRWSAADAAVVFEQMLQVLVELAAQVERSNGLWSVALGGGIVVTDGLQRRVSGLAENIWACVGDSSYSPGVCGDRIR